MAHLTNFSFEFVYEIFTENASLCLLSLYHGAKSQKWPKTQIKGSCLKFSFISRQSTPRALNCDGTVAQAQSMPRMLPRSPTASVGPASTGSSLASQLPTQLTKPRRWWVRYWSTWGKIFRSLPGHEDVKLPWLACFSTELNRMGKFGLQNKNFGFTFRKYSNPTWSKSDARILILNRTFGLKNLPGSCVRLL